eukprot:573980-Karenia_brevis.AAC.1
MRNQLGDWKDVPDRKGPIHASQEPMVVRYSGSRLQTTSFVKRVCLQPVFAACSAVDDTSDVPMEALRQYSSQHNELLKLADNDRWGKTHEISLPQLSTLDVLEGAKDDDKSDDTEGK